MAHGPLTGYAVATSSTGLLNAVLGAPSSVTGNHTELPGGSSRRRTRPAPRTATPLPRPASVQVDGRLRARWPVPDRAVNQGVQGNSDKRPRRGPGERRDLFDPPDRRHGSDQSVVREYSFTSTRRESDAKTSHL